MACSYKDQLHLCTLTTEQEDLYPIQNTVVPSNKICYMNLSIFPIWGQKRAVNGMVLWHIPFLKDRIAAVTVGKGIPLSKIIRADVMI